MKKLALVTGASGFIGGRLAEKLIGEGWDVRLFVRDPTRLLPALRTIDDLIVGDLLDEASVARAVKDVEVIFHCAANVRTWDTWKAYYDANVSVVKNLMHAIATENPGLSRLVHLSTADVYGFPDSPSDEDSKTTGGGFGYGETKLLGEKVVTEYGAKFQLSYTIIRPCNVIGPGSQFITRIGSELKSGIMLTVNGGRANAGLVYIDNLVDRLIWAACAENAHQECFNVRDEYDVSWSTFLNRFRSAIKGRGVMINLPFGIANGLARIFEAFHSVLLPSKEPLLHRLIVRIFGRTCGHSAKRILDKSSTKDKIGFDEAIDRSCLWFLQNESSK